MGLFPQKFDVVKGLVFNRNGQGYACWMGMNVFYSIGSIVASKVYAPVGTTRTCPNPVTSAPPICRVVLIYWGHIATQIRSLEVKHADQKFE
jgi:hypothetical protein